MRWILATAFLLGCIKQGPSDGTNRKRQSKTEGGYTVDSPGTGWSKIKPGGADKAWYHSESSATIYFDSNCQERFEDGKLTALLTHLTFGVARGEPTRQEALMLDGREALLRVQPGLIDGVTVKVGAMVTKKDGCLYDGLLIAPPSTFENHWSTFATVVASFKTKGN